jgi:uncharacterized protein (TIRG00374 family)
MSSGLKKTIRYTGVLLFTGLLLWLTVGNIELVLIREIWRTASTPYLLLSAFIAVLSHYFRAARWKLLLNPIGYPLKTTHSFMSVMVGYFINLAIPRGGELSRCYNLYKLNKTPVNISFGTVISERIIDLVFLLALIGTVLIIQLETFLDFFSNLELTKATPENSSGIFLILSVGMAIVLMLVGVYLYSKRKMQLFRFVVKLKSFLIGIKSGVFSLLKLEKRGLFILFSLLIWVCYYLMNYFVMQAFPSTSELDLFAALTIFVIGGIALAVPLPGGAGSYHLLVTAGLTMIYAVANDHAIAFSVIVHAWQTLIIIVLGAGSLVLSQVYYKSMQK